jgi:putative tricarboxylic transport membrane protein
MKKGAFNQSFMTGAEYVNWLKKAAALHRNLMEKAGFIHQGS